MTIINLVNNITKKGWYNLIYVNQLCILNEI